MYELSINEVEKVSGAAGASVIDLGGITLELHPEFSFNATDSLGFGAGLTGVANAVEKGFEFSINKGIETIGGLF
ncbi:hypothetical protein [Acinetobacter rudis]|uniref:Uncharacterized protein n=1 Tax=Acinetobacter rudis CIP 110305 TaxID=421052 RepID=S3NB65_9GAMM|nr:hypothetical protein [Acinetobacter rudis]EPF77320.1 hypothetical protein F945_00986 [Acinetobacter rudis CIP 110305]